MKNDEKRNKMVGLKGQVLRFFSSGRNIRGVSLVTLALTVFVIGSLTNVKKENMEPLSFEVTVPKQHQALTYMESIRENQALCEQAEKTMGVSLNVGVAKINACNLLINGKVVAVLKNEQQATGVLDYFKFRYIDESSEIVDVTFAQHVELQPVEYSVADFRGFDSVEDAKDRIAIGDVEQRQHVVSSGENYWLIAQNYGVELEDIQTANPGLDMNSLLVGQTLNLVAPAPLLTVRTNEKITYSEEVEYGVVYEDTDSMYIGESKVKSDGVYGEIVVEAEIQKENGVIIGKKILSENHVSEPVDKVVYQGTMDPPPRMGTGILGYPLAVYGVVTSEFGDTTYWRGHPHRGIDVGCPQGTSVLAADGGVVVAAGWASGYGYRVVIDHGGNISTLYAHCSQINVNVGDQVYKGQTVAYSGMTGWATGPHLHFEVRLNGVYQNPRNYVGF